MKRILTKLMIILFFILHNIFDIHMLNFVKIFIKFKVVYLDMNYLGVKY